MKFCDQHNFGAKNQVSSTIQWIFQHC